MKITHSGDRLREKLAERRVTPTDFAKSAGVSTQVLNNWFGRGVPAKEQIRISRALGVRYEWLVSAEGSSDADTASVEADHSGLTPMSVWDDNTPLDDDEVYVPFLKEVELSAGGGRTAIQQSSSQKLRFGKMTLRRQNVQPSEAVCCTVSGNSMEPVLPNGSTVGVNKGCTAITDGKMYAINHDGQLRVKTLYRLPGGGIRLRSYNRDEHPDEEYDTQEMSAKQIHIIGKVFWYSVLL
jgi:phage repressor protein C with HTH and peptisase S24 domain